MSQPLSTASSGAAKKPPRDSNHFDRMSPARHLPTCHWSLFSRGGAMRIRILGSLLGGVLGFVAAAQGQTYKSHIEHPIVRYKMSARLDPGTKKVVGQYTLTWWNHTADAIPDLYFHLYLNAFKNVDSTFMRESGARRPGGLDGWMAR